MDTNFLYWVMGLPQVFIFWALFQPGRVASVAYTGFVVVFFFAACLAREDWFIFMQSHGTGSEARRGLVYALVLVWSILMFMIPLCFSSRQMSICVKLKATAAFLFSQVVGMVILVAYINMVIGNFFSPSATVVDKIFFRTIGDFF
mmetsp:Transcript_35878/g.83178  ORF Transcript_35878/g.83178 Transcript_35878/m.83178 type:complete len:146 (-) Transcript_35878:55-492(-)